MNRRMCEKFLILGEIKNKKTGMIKNGISSVCCGKDAYMNRNTLFSSCLKKKKNSNNSAGWKFGMQYETVLLNSLEKLRLNRWKIISNWPI